jgi:Domain of Unknown Function (DUF928)
MNLMQRILWATAGTIALVGFQISSRPLVPKADTTSMNRQSVDVQSGLRSGLQMLGAIELATATTFRYVPPSRRGAPARTQGGGSRGCEQESVPVTLLAPPDHVGLTTQARPKLFWYSANDSMLPMKISLVEPGVSEPIWVTQVPTGSAGFNQIQIPETVPELVAGRRYRWTVTRLCNVRRPSNNTYARGWVERIATTEVPSNIQSLAPAERVKLYAESGIWYDAVTQAVEQSRTSDPESTSIVMMLLEQGGLTRVVQQEQKRLSRRAAGSPPGQSLRVTH